MAEILSNIKDRLKFYFEQENGLSPNANGYVKSPQENLMTKEIFNDIEGDFSQGSGNELYNKFLALHSSSALVANSFGIWKRNPQKLILCSHTDFKILEFEKKLPTGLKGTPPNLDVVVSSDKTLIGIESKFTEYLYPKGCNFSDSYNITNLPYVESKWIHLIEKLKKDEKKYYLDKSQLIKHYLGLVNSKNSNKKIILLYLYWEPLNWHEFDVFKRHREEIEGFSELIEDKLVEFQHMSYSYLWKEWLNQTSDHHFECVTRLTKRYEFEL